MLKKKEAWMIKFRKHVVTMLIISLILTVVIIGCTAPAPTPTPTPTPTTPTTPAKEQPQYGGTLKIVMNMTMSNFGYTPTMSGAMAYPTDPVYEGLIWVNMLTGAMEPWLAESWQQDPTGKFITFKLRKGVKFHDGTEFNAQALKDFLTMKKAAMKGWLPNVESMDVVDSHTLKLNTSSIDALFISNLNEQLSSPTYLAKGQDTTQFAPVGTGPYKFSEFKRDSYLRYVRFDDYWGGKQYLDGVEYIFVPDPETQVTTLLAGEAQIIYNLPLKDIARMKPANFALPSMPAVYNGFCPDSANADSPLSNKKVLEAIDCAINKEEIAKSLGYGGFIKPMDSVIPSNIPGYTAGAGRKYDPNRAKQLLTEANFPNGFETTIVANSMANPDTIVAAQSDLAKVGIKARIDNADMGRWMSMRTTGWKNTLLYVHGVYGQPFEYYFERTWAKARPDSYKSAARPAGFDDMLSKMITEMDAKARTSQLQAIAKAMQDEGTFIPFIIREQVASISPKIHDYGIYKDNMTRAGFHKYKTWMSK
jgi:peptide/nickel transport system substrate-binding protein